jgi:hypothetical protein
VRWSRSLYNSNSFQKVSGIGPQSFAHGGKPGRPCNSAAFGMTDLCPQVEDAQILKAEGVAWRHGGTCLFLLAVFLTGDRGFESISLQRRVCELSRWVGRKRIRLFTSGEPGA